MVLAALAEQCTKATFFSIGKMALGYPEIIREVAKAGHTIGTHTWSHKTIRDLKTFEEGKDEIERGVSAVKRAVNGPVAPFFRFPTLKDTPESVAYLGTRNIAMFSTDIDSFDFKPQPAENIVKVVLAKLEKNGKALSIQEIGQLVFGPEVRKGLSPAADVIAVGAASQEGNATGEAARAANVSSRCAASRRSLGLVML